MLDYIGEKVRDSVLSGLPWVSRSAGLVDVVRSADGGNYPGARPYVGGPLEDVGDYVNMAPQEGETCIAFVDSDADTRRVLSHAKFFDFETFFRVVVWLDERRVSVDIGNMMWGLQSGITAGVLAVSFNTDGMLRTKCFFDAIQHDQAEIWRRYQMGQEKQGLFLLPYRTFAIRFRLIGRMVPACFTYPITANQGAC